MATHSEDVNEISTGNLLGSGIVIHWSGSSNRNRQMLALSSGEENVNLSVLRIHRGIVPQQWPGRQRGSQEAAAMVDRRDYWWGSEI